MSEQGRTKTMKTDRRLLSLDAVLERVPLSRPAIDRLEARNEFPRRRHLGRRIFWVSTEIDTFIKNLPAEDHAS